MKNIWTELVLLNAYKFISSLYIFILKQPITRRLKVSVTKLYFFREVITDILVSVILYLCTL